MSSNPTAPLPTISSNEFPIVTFPLAGPFATPVSDWKLVSRQCKYYDDATPTSRLVKIRYTWQLPRCHTFVVLTVDGLITSLDSSLALVASGEMRVLSYSAHVAFCVTALEGGYRIKDSPLLKERMIELMQRTILEGSTSHGGGTLCCRLSTNPW